MATPEPNPSNVALLLPFAGIGGAPITQDYSPNPKTSELLGWPRLTKAVTRGGYEYVGEFSSGGFLTTEPSTDFDLSGMWVVEASVFLPYGVVCSSSDQAPLFSFGDRLSNTNRLAFYFSVPSSPAESPDLRVWSDNNVHYLPIGTVMTDEDYFDRWIHVAFQRIADGPVQVFLDGVLAAEGTATAAPRYRDYLTINVSRSGQTARSTNGMFMSDLRVTIGEAFYPDTGFEPPKEGYLAHLVTSPLPPFDGDGYFAGAFPDGITSVEGVPAPATVRVLYRGGEHDPLDGHVVWETESGPDGTWVVEGLNPAFRYDVVCRHEGFNDLILSDVTPMT